MQVKEIKVYTCLDCEKQCYSRFAANHCCDKEIEQPEEEV